MRPKINQSHLAWKQYFSNTDFMETIIRVNERGSLTLPKEIRKKFGLENGGQLILNEANNSILLTPGMMVPVEIYSDERISEFDNEEAKLKKFKL